MMKLRPAYGGVALVAATALIAVVAACGSSSGDEPGSSGGASSSSGTSGESSSGASSSSGFNVGDGSSGSSGSSGDASPFDPDAACATTTAAAKRVPPNLLFIIDRSGSMNCNPPPDTASTTCEQFPVTADMGKPTKWSITKAALKSAVAAMPATNSVGMTYFNVDDDCAVQATPNVAMSPIDATQLTLVNASLDGVTPKGFTPIVGGVTLGYQYLHTNAFTGKKVLVLITDGSETCAPDQTANFVSKTVLDAAAVGIRTYVIGAPGSEDNRAFLSQVAFNGGTAKTASCTHAAAPVNVGDCHFDLTNAGTNLATELNAALDTISKEALGCEFDVPQADGGAIDYNKVNVLFTPSGGGAQQTVSQDATVACGSANGWQYSPDKSRIFLCGSACAAVKNDPGSSISIALGCATQTVPR